MRILGIAVTAVAMGWPAAASADDIVLRPTGDWTLRKRPDVCLASRVFGSGDDRTTLTLEQAGPEPHYKVTVVGRPMRHPHGRGIRIRFGPNEDESIRSYLSATSRSGRPAIVMYGVYPSPPDATKESASPPEPIGEVREAAITHVRLSTALIDPLRLETGPMGQTFAALRDCANEINMKLEWYGTQRGGDSRPPKPLNADEVRRTVTRVYPSYLIRAEIGATLGVRLSVNEEGRPTTCVIEGSTRPQLFEDILCLNLLKTARFEPARDMAGRPVAAYYRSSWKFEVR